jgi:hypothetical protein
MNPLELIKSGLQIWTGTYIKSVSDVGGTEVAQVASTCLSEVAYEVASQTLTVEFKQSGSRYMYFFVPESDYEELVSSLGSVGETYNDIIKDNYNFLKVA